MVKKGITRNSKVDEDIEVTEDTDCTNDIGDVEDIEENEDIEPELDALLLPAVTAEESSQALTVYRPEKLPVSPDDPLLVYLREIGRYKLLTPEEEKSLTLSFYDSGDIEIAKKLVEANLRLVVKIAMEYRYAYSNLMDLVQEGNIGLMKAVSKFNPQKGAKLSYYASWWIRSYILKFILDNFRLIKIGTTREQKKLFYNLLREKDRLMSMGIRPETKLLSENLGVSEKSVNIMNGRLGKAGAEISLDKPQFDQEGHTRTMADMIPSTENPIEEELGNLQAADILRQNLGAFLATLKERDRDIFEKRLLSEVPPSLQSIADEYGVSRERVRQIEERLTQRLKSYMSEYIR